MDVNVLKSTPDAVITARLHPSHFKMSDSNYDSLSLASDGNLYYTLCSHNIDTYARVYRFNPKDDEVICLGDIGEIVGEAGTKSIPQGKSHSPYYECEGKLYFATHCGYYKASSNKEEPGEVPPGYKPYPGGHLVSYDMSTGEFENLLNAPVGEGILTINMDTKRKRLYGLTWPRGFFIYYNVDTGEKRDLGRVSREGELGDGETYFCLCRSLGIVPGDGSVYFTNADGEIKRYYYPKDRVESTGLSLKRDIFGYWNEHEPGHQGYNWRKVFWHSDYKKFFAIHPRSGYLFSYDPEAGKVEILERISADELRKNGRFEPFHYGYLGFTLGPDRETLYYLTGTYGLETEDGRKVNEALHLTTYSLRTDRYTDHGVLRLEDGRYPNMTQTLVVHPNGRIYSVPWIEKLEKDRSADDKVGQQVDLISFDNPLTSHPGEPSVT